MEAFYTQLKPCVFILFILSAWVVLSALRQIQRDLFIHSSNKKREKELYGSQSLFKKLTLSYLKPYLGADKKFGTWSRAYCIYLCIFLLSFIALICSEILSPAFCVLFGAAASALNIIFIILFRIFVFKKGMNTFSKYADK